jgi:hypothetical protein
MSPSRAEYYAHVDSSRLEMLNIGTPYELKNKLTGWHRGGIRFNQYTEGSGSDLVVTGPKLRVAFDGCRWNRIVFAMTGEEEVRLFAAWLTSIETYMEATVNSNPSKFKVNQAYGTARVEPSVRASSNSSYPDDLRCRLSVTYAGEEGEATSMSNADLFSVGEDGVRVPIDPSEIKSGWAVVPVFKISYQKMANSFMLVLTVLKGRVYKTPSSYVTNEEWEIDYPMDVSN